MIIEELQDYIKIAFRNADKSHDYQHSIRVYQNAMLILEEFCDANKEIVVIAALLHDVVDEKLFNNEELLDGWFKKHPSIYESSIRKVISEISYSKAKAPTTIESMIVQDADRLDAIGAIGIARVFTYGGAIGRPIYSKTEKCSIDHFYEKLFNIKSLMNTKTGYRIAAERHKFMEEYIEVFKKENKLL